MMMDVILIFVSLLTITGGDYAWDGNDWVWNSKDTKQSSVDNFADITNIEFEDLSFSNSLNVRGRGYMDSKSDEGQDLVDDEDFIEGSGASDHVMDNFDTVRQRKVPIDYEDFHEGSGDSDLVMNNFDTGKKIKVPIDDEDFDEGSGYSDPVMNNFETETKHKPEEEDFSEMDAETDFEGENVYNEVQSRPNVPDTSSTMTPRRTGPEVHKKKPINFKTEIKHKVNDDNKDGSSYNNVENTDNNSNLDLDLDYSEMDSLYSNLVQTENKEVHNEIPFKPIVTDTPSTTNPSKTGPEVNMKGPDKLETETNFNNEEEDFFAEDSESDHVIVQNKNKDVYNEITLKPIVTDTSSTTNPSRFDTEVHTKGSTTFETSTKLKDEERDFFKNESESDIDIEEFENKYVYHEIPSKTVTDTITTTNPSRTGLEVHSKGPTKIETETKHKETEEDFPKVVSESGYDQVQIENTGVYNEVPSKPIIPDIPTILDIPSTTNLSGTGSEVHKKGTTNHQPESFFAQSGILAAVIGGAVVGLLCAILLVILIVYRMRKKDEGSFAVDEPKKSHNSISYSKAPSQEYYA